MTLRIIITGFGKLTETEKYVYEGMLRAIARSHVLSQDFIFSFSEEIFPEKMNLKGNRIEIIVVRPDGYRVVPGIMGNLRKTFSQNGEYNVNCFWAELVLVSEERD